MEQKDKELLLRDLSARLPYLVKVTWDGKYPITLTPSIYVALWKEERDQNIPKVYLRPMSSMTEEEKKEYVSFLGGQKPFECDFSAYPKEYKFIYEWDVTNYINWLNAHHFDFRLTSEGLSMIEAGLALEAPEGMYNIKEK